MKNERTEITIGVVSPHAKHLSSKVIIADPDRTYDTIRKKLDQIVEAAEKIQAKKAAKRREEAEREAKERAKHQRGQPKGRKGTRKYRSKKNRGRKHRGAPAAPVKGEIKPIRTTEAPKALTEKKPVPPAAPGETSDVKTVETPRGDIEYRQVKRRVGPRARVLEDKSFRCNPMTCCYPTSYEANKHVTHESRQKVKTFEKKDGTKVYIVCNLTFQEQAGESE